MPDNRVASDEIDRLIQLMCDGIASASDRKSLGEAIQADPQVLQKYTEAVYLCIDLPDFTAHQVAEVSDEWASESCEVAAAKRGTTTGWIASRSFLAGGLAITATVLVGAACLFYVWPSANGVATVVSSDNQHAPNDPSSGLTPPGLQYVARIIYGSPDLQWVRGEAPTDFLLRVAAGKPLSISSGVLEIEFGSKTRIILQAPATFVPLGRDSARLVRGKLTGKVETPGFHLVAGSVDIVDLGTEFGVVVDEQSGTDTHVFDGLVEIRLEPRNSSAEKMLLRQGMTASVDSLGNPLKSKDLLADSFIRNASPNRRTDELDGRLTLIDLISGSVGFGEQLAGAIDPNTGAWDFENPLYRDDGHKGDRLGNGLYHPTDHSEFIDGTFAPTSSQRRIQIDSVGSHCEVGEIDGKHYGAIWVRRKSNLDRAVQFNTDFWGTDTLGLILDQLAQAEEGIMGLHPNAGITIDVQRIREKLGALPTKFVATVVNLEKVDTRGKNKTADLRVLCDGKVAYSRLNFSSGDGPEQVSVPLEEDTHFLTIFSTDGELGIWFDHVVLIDPFFVID